MRKLLALVLCLSLPANVRCETNVRPYPCDLSEQFTAVSAADITDVTSTTVATAAGSGLRRYIYNWTVSNMSASVSTRVDLIDGSTVIDTCPASAGGGCTKAYPMPLRSASNSAIKCQAATTGAAVRCSVSGCQSSR